MLTAIEKTLAECPLLAAIYSTLRSLAKRERENIARDQRETARVQRVSRECLAQLAKIWGYNHPQWLRQYLPLIGYRPSDAEGSQHHFDRVENRVNAIFTICHHAILAGNIEALEVAFDYIPPTAFKCYDFSEGREPWGFLYLAHKEVSPATRLVMQKRWTSLEFSGFARCYGLDAAQTLRSISPAYNEYKGPLPRDVSQDLFGMWAFRTSTICSKMMFFQLTQLADEQLSRFEAPATSKIRRYIGPSQSVPEHLLKHFPYHLANWGLEPRLDAPDLAPDQWHRKILGEIDDPIDCQEVPSFFQALATFLYGCNNLASDIRALCRLYFGEAVGSLKVRVPFQDLFDQMPIGKSTCELASVSGGRHRILLGGAIVCALIAHLYRVQVHFSCLLKLNVLEIEGLLKDLKWHFELLKIDEGGLTIDQVLQLHKDKSSLSLLFNAECRKRCEIFAVEHQVALSGSRWREPRGSLDARGKGDQNSPPISDLVGRKATIIAYSWRSASPLSK